ncbi:MAG: prephenate dehydratase [Syntrophomonas sp.]
MSEKIAYLGPTGTFCEEAARRYSRQPTTLVPYRSIESVFLAVHKGEAESGIVPIENSCEGAVNQTLDLLTSEYQVKISGDLILPVNHNIMLRPGVNTSDVTCVLSHPQALAQCHQYISNHLPQAAILEVASTAEAARQVALSAEPWAAIGNRGAAAAFGLDIGQAAINDIPNNKTRFIVLVREDSKEHVRTGKCKTSLLIYLADQPGSLFHVLQEFYVRNINLTKIESRPTRAKIGDYLFFIDIEGHRLEEHINESLQSLSSLCPAVRVLGSYPTAM